MEKTDEAETAARLRRAITQLNRRLRQSALGGISPAQASMLSSIERLSNPTLGELAAREQIQPPSVTRLVRTLEDAGFVSLIADLEDRRITRVQMSLLGKKELLTIRRRKTEFLETQLRALPITQRAKAAELVALLEHLLARE